MLETIEELDDFDGTLLEMAEIIQDAIAKYGVNAKIRFDAGHNNVQVIVDRG